MFGKKKKDEFQTGLESSDEHPLMAPEPSDEAKPVSAIDIQQQEFRLSFRGYNEKDVDEFLDGLTETFTQLTEENRRLRAGAPVSSAPSPDAAREAEEIKTAARMEADRILREARGQAAADAPAAASGATVGTAGVSRFLNEERDFLQGLAGMIQQHAESVRATAKSAQEEQRAAAAALPAIDDEPPAPASMPAPSEPSAHRPETAASPVPEPEAERGQSTAFGSAWAATMAAEPSPAPEAAAGSVATATETATETEIEAPSVVEVEGPSVVAIPPSPVDKPQAPAPEIASAETAGSDADDGGSGDAQNSAPTDAPQDQRSLRELFWGED